ncbi:MAG TPA: VOC family protein [Jiangellales bacterium]|nr:VOC family protein [Jiangellales bacterium]
MTDTRTRTAVWPVLVYADARAAIRFLVDAFGFEVTALHPQGGDGPIEHAEVRWPGGGGVMLGSPRPGGVLDGLPPGTGAVYVVTDEPDALYERAVSAGATVVRGLQDEAYGSRDFVVRDPEGVVWSFGTYAGE